MTPTSTTHSPDVLITADGISTTITLPPPRLGAIQHAGWIMILFGLFFSGFAVFWSIKAAGFFAGFVHWPRHLFASFAIPTQIASIRCENSNTAINGRPLRELRINTTDGNRKGFFDGRDDSELSWLAATLSNFYSLPKATPVAHPASDPKNPTPPLS